jgi:hypothetical protein
MADPINFDEALADPPDLIVEPPALPRRPPEVPKPTRDIPNQLISAAAAWRLRDDFISGKRDPSDPENDDAFELPESLKANPTQGQTDVELATSNSTRDELGIDRINEGLFNQFRNPDISRELVIQFLEAMGLETELQEDLSIL